MPSTRSGALRAQFRSMSDRFAANPGMDLVTLRSMMEELGTLASEPPGVTYEEVETEEVRGIWCDPVDASREHVVLYLHGGGFVGNTAASHRRLAGHLAKATGARVLDLEYRLAPEHTYPAQLDDAVAAYRWLREQGFEAGHIATAGDSAGGGLAVSVAVKLRELGEPLPAAVIGFSPWVDMEHLGATLDTNADTDAFVSRDVAGMMSGLFLGTTSPSDPLVNPLHADLAGMPPMYFTAGGHEVLQDNAERLAARARDAGVEVELTLEPGQQHVYPFMVGRAPEADDAVHGAGHWARTKLGLG